MQRPRMHFLAAAVMVPLALFGRGTAARQVTPNTPPARVPGYVLPTGELQEDGYIALDPERVKDELNKLK